MNIDELDFDPNPIESRRNHTRYEITDEDMQEHCLNETEWFCEDCGELVPDIDEPECDCNTAANWVTDFKV
jgi:hypothetical protein